jgi:hypothetical protein
MMVLALYDLDPSTWARTIWYDFWSSLAVAVAARRLARGPLVPLPALATAGLRRLSK